MNQNANTPEFVQQIVKRAIELEAEKLITEAKKELERRTPEIIAGITVEMMRMVEYQTLADRIVFTIRKPEN